MADERAPRQSSGAAGRCGRAGNWTISAVHLALSGRVPNIDRAKFDEIAADAKANCPVSRVLKADITLDAKLA